MIHQETAEPSAVFFCLSGAAEGCALRVEGSFVNNADTIDIFPLNCYNIYSISTLEKCTVRGEI